MVVVLALILAAAAALLPPDVLSYPFYDECQGLDAECQGAVIRAKPFTVLALLVLCVDAVRISDQLLMRAMMHTMEPLVAQTVCVAGGMGLGWWFA